MIPKRRGDFTKWTCLMRFLFLLEYNCFTMLGYFLLYSEVNEPYANLYPLLLGPPSYLTPIPPLCVITEHRAKLPVLSSSFPLAVYFTHGSVYIGEGNGTPLQYSCLENPRDGGTWWAAISGVTQSWT